MCVSMSACVHPVYSIPNHNTKCVCACLPVGILCIHYLTTTLSQKWSNQHKTSSPGEDVKRGNPTWGICYRGTVWDVCGTSASVHSGRTETHKQLFVYTTLKKTNNTSLDHTEIDKQLLFTPHCNKHHTETVKQLLFTPYWNRQTPLF